MLKFRDIVVAYDDMKTMPETILGAMILVNSVLSIKNLILYEQTKLDLYANIALYCSICNWLPKTATLNNVLLFLCAKAIQKNVYGCSR